MTHDTLERAIVDPDELLTAAGAEWGAGETCPGCREELGGWAMARDLFGEGPLSCHHCGAVLSG